MNPDLFQFVDVLAVPVIGGIILWIWKLDARVFDIKASLIDRDEFRSQMQEIRAELAEIRKALITGYYREPHA